MAPRAANAALSEAAKASLAALRSRVGRDAGAASIVRRVEALRAILLGNALHGEVVRKPLPRALVQKHGVINLYVEDLPAFWRLLYTVVRVGMRPYVMVLEIVDHATYDSWFPSRGR